MVIEGYAPTNYAPWQQRHWRRASEYHASWRLKDIPQQIRPQITYYHDPTGNPASHLDRSGCARPAFKHFAFYYANLPRALTRHPVQSKPKTDGYANRHGQDSRKGHLIRRTAKQFKIWLQTSELSLEHDPLLDWVIGVSHEKVSAIAIEFESACAISQPEGNCKGQESWRSGMGHLHTHP